MRNCGFEGSGSMVERDPRGVPEAGAGSDGGQRQSEAVEEIVPLSYSPAKARSANDLGYYERREVLYLALRAHGFTTCSDLAAELGWSPHEVRAKLMSLRTDGMAEYDAPEWHDVWDSCD